MKRFFFFKSKKSFHLLLLALTVFCFFSFYSIKNVGVTTPNCSASLSYDYELQKFFVVPDTLDAEQLAPLEKIHLSPLHEIKHVNECIDSDDSFTKTTIWLNSEESLPEWMPKMKKTVETRTQLNVFDSDENNVFTKNKSQGEIGLFDNNVQNALTNGLGIPTDFSTLVSLEEQQLILNNFTITIHVDGSMEATNGNEEVFIYPATKKVVRNYLENDGSIRAVETNLYSVDENNELMPVEYNLETYITLPRSGACVKEVLIQRFSNYSRNDGNGLLYHSYENDNLQAEQLSSQNKKTNTEDDNLLIYPNPVSDLLQAKLPAASSSESETIVKIIDGMGKVIFIQNVPSGSLVKIPTTTYNPGMYFIHATIDGVAYSQRFIKH